MAINPTLIALQLAAAPTSPAPTTPAPTDFTKVDKAILDAFNPLLIENSPVAAELSKPGSLISRLLSFVFPLAGMIMFVMLIAAGFEIMGAAATKKSIDTGKQRASAAVIGFILLFASYWLVQILELVFNIKILGN